MADVIQQTLHDIRIPDHLGIARKSDVPVEERTEEFHRIFDATTLIYDCCFVPHIGAYVFTGPRMRNLWPVFRRGLRIGGRRPRWMRRRDVGRSSQVVVRARPAPVTMDLGGTTIRVPVRPSIAHAFAGLNAAVTLNKDNDPEHILDWIRYNIGAHGLEAVLIFDNGSTAYTLDALAEQIGRVSGLKSAALVSAPFKYGGPYWSSAGRTRLHFLQPSLLNLARAEALSRARAVLGTDIDELVIAEDGGSIFDAAARERFGFVRLEGEWMFPPRGTPAPAPHAVHSWRPETSMPCNGKWAVRPDAWLSRLYGWNVHVVGGKPGRKVKADSRFRLVHCAATTTGWKSRSERWDVPENLVEDASVARRLSATLGHM